MVVGTILFIPGGLGVLELGMTGLLLQSGVVISTGAVSGVLSVSGDYGNKSFRPLNVKELRNSRHIARA
jgi:hypothetical protein